MSKSRPVAYRPCIECGSVGQRSSDLCQKCRVGAPIRLRGGAWVLDKRTRILRWEKAS